MKKKFIKYSIAVDIGTNSIGWAIIGEDYILLKINRHDAWGVILFDSAETAATRRGYRSSRRRIERRRERIRLLQELLAEEVGAVDEKFYVRLKESSYHLGEGRYFRSNRYNLFEDKDYTDVQYFHDYPTIYHLRERLVKDDSKADIRLVYLALHHIIKYRGHFLNEGDVNAAGSSPEVAAEELFALLASGDEVGGAETDLRYADKTQAFVAALKNTKESKSKRYESACVVLAQAENKKCVAAVAKAAVGLKFDLSDLLCLEDEDRIKGEDGKDVKLSFTDGDLEQKRDGLLGDCAGRAPIFEAAEKLYAAIELDRVLRGKKLLCEAMTDKFAKHGRDLALLRKLIRAIGDKELYNGFFRKSDGASYTGYVGDKRYGFYGGAKDKCVKISRADLYKRIKDIMDKYVPDGEEKSYVLSEIEKEDFLPLVTSKDNAYIPYQLNLKELNAILENQGKFHPCLAKNADKIRALLTFRRPYYIGTLKGAFSWANGVDIPANKRLTPWNFFQVLGEEGKDKLAENFISRMTNDCFLIEGESALPCASMLYQKYVLLNEINKLKFNDKPISVEQKKEIYALCRKRKSVKKTDIAHCMRVKFGIAVDPEKISGFSDEKKLTANLSTYIDFVKMFGEEFVEKNFDACEEVVRVLTIFNDADIRKKRINALKVFDGFEEKLAKKKYSGWGKYSRKALYGTLGKDGRCVLDIMYETNQHINEILWKDEYGFKEKFIREEEEITKFSYDRHVRDLRMSPVVKRGVWNTLSLIEEIVKEVGCPPSHIYVETTQEIGQKKRTKSRYEQIKKLYKEIEDEGKRYSQDIAECQAELKKHENTPEDLDSEKFYLWLRQLGRSMYSDNKIDFRRIKDCEVDHIVPRSAKAIPDDSLENKVLVLKGENQDKGGMLGISPAIILKMRSFWEFLYKNGLIGSKKFKALQKTDYSEAELRGFAGRQLNDTGYIVSSVRELLKRRFPQADVRGVKPKLSSIMRKKFAEEGYSGFYKIRDLNDFHHAKDAYLAAVLGQFTTKAFPYWGQSEYCKDLKDKIEKLYSTERRLSERELALEHNRLVSKRFGFIIDTMCSNERVDDETGEVAWGEHMLENVLRTMARNTCRVVKKKEFMANGDFYDQTVYSPKSSKKDLIPLKSEGGEDMPTRFYGGYSSEKPAYFAVIRYKEKGKTAYAFGGVPVRELIKGADAVTECIRQEYGEDAEAVRKIYKYQMVDYEGQKFYITGVEELQNAEEIYVPGLKNEALLYLAERKKIRVLSGEEPFYETQKDIEKIDPEFRWQYERHDYTKEFNDFIKQYCNVVKMKQPKFNDLAVKLEELLANGSLPGALTWEERIELLGQLMHVSSAGSGVVVLNKKLNGGRYGRVRQRNDFIQKAIFIDQSVTGLFVRTQKEV